MLAAARLLAAATLPTQRVSNHRWDLPKGDPCDRTLEQSPQDLEVFLCKLARGQPFGFSHMNHGEIQSCVQKTGGTVDRGWQTWSTEFRDVVCHVFRMERQPGLVYGIPCQHSRVAHYRHTVLDLMNIPHSKAGESADSQRWNLVCCESLFESLSFSSHVISLRR